MTEFELRCAEERLFPAWFRFWRELPERWASRCVVAANDNCDLDARGPCWSWRGWNSGNGFGKTRVAGRAMMAHRAVWEFFFGPVPAGLVLDHTCRNRACVNPFHCEPVTPAENTRRGLATLFQKRAA